MIYAIVAVLLIAVILYIQLRKSIKKTVYSIKNVNLCALIICCVMLLITFVADGAFNSYFDGFQRVVFCIKRFPSYFANLSIWGFSALGIMMFISNISLVRHEGMKPTNMIGTFLGVITVGATVVVYAISLVFEKVDALENYLFISKFLPTFFYLVLDYCESIILGITVMGYVASRQTPKYDKDFIIILGCSISKNGGLRPLIKGRTQRAIKYAWDQEIATGKKVCYVPSGGQGSDEIMSEGSAMELYLLSHSAEPYEVFPEKLSVNTFENFAFSKKIIEEQNKNAKIAFATTNYHMFRSGLLAQQNGIDAEGIASKTKWYFWPNGFAREIVAIFNMTKKQHIISAAIMLVISNLIVFIL